MYRLLILGIPKNEQYINKSKLTSQLPFIVYSKLHIIPIIILVNVFFLMIRNFIYHITILNIFVIVSFIIIILPFNELLNVHTVII